MAKDLQSVVGIIMSLGQLSCLEPNDDFYDAGFSSFGSLQLVLELEDAWGVSIPDDEFVMARTAQQLHQLMVRLAQAEVTR